jgi:hypothetical protein
MDLKRASAWLSGKLQRRLPLYFPSVSSVKTNWPPVDCVRVLNRIAEGEQYLVSAYDLMRGDWTAREALIGELRTSGNADTLVLMDSGNYESFWKSPNSPWEPGEFHEALRIAKPQVAFGFDNQEPPADYAGYLQQINMQYEADRSIIGRATIVPIVHGSPQLLAKLCPAIVQDQDIDAIAVPERSLGAGIFDRVKAVGVIREALNRTGRYIVLHLLGTGNPISLALYSNAGADSFDGLEWCHTVVDHETALLHHFSQGDFFRRQTKWGGIDVSYIPRTLAHNLEFYRDWMSRLVDALAVDEGETFCRHNFPERIYVQCAAELGWEQK